MHTLQQIKSRHPDTDKVIQLFDDDVNKEAAPKAVQLIVQQAGGKIYKMLSMEEAMELDRSRKYLQDGTCTCTSPSCPTAPLPTIQILAR